MLLKQAEIFSAWFKVLAAVLLSVHVYWNITPYGQVYIYRRFERGGASIFRVNKPNCLILKKKAGRTY